MQDEDIVAFSKVKTKEIVQAALNRQKASKMKNNYRRSLGIPPSHLRKYSSYKFSRKVKDEELIA